MTSPWDLIKAKEYEAAVSEYSRLYQEEGRNSHLANRGTAYLLMGNYAAALQDFQHIIQTGDPGDSSTGEYIHAGISFWFLNRPDEAVSMWRAGLAAPYADAAGGVEVPALLLYAGCRLENPALHKDATQLLKKHWRKQVRRQQRQQERSHPTHADLVHPGLVAWPGAIVPYLLGEIDQTQLQQSVDQAGNDILIQRWQCAAHFYVGLHAAGAGDWQTFQERMRRCAESDSRELEHESYLAHWEVERGYPKPAFPPE